MATKIEKLLSQRKLTQGDFIGLIKKKSGFTFGRAYISKIVSGKLKNYTVTTALLMSEALGVKIDDIVELKNIKKINK